MKYVNIIGGLLCAVLIFLGQRGGGPIFVPPKPLIDAPGLNVLIIEETDDRRTLPPDQTDVLSSTTVRAFVKEHNGDIRVFDKDTPIADEEAKWRPAMKEAQSLPWLVISSPKGNSSAPLPVDVESTVSAIGKYAE